MAHCVRCSNTSQPTKLMWLDLMQIELCTDCRQDIIRKIDRANKPKCPSFNDVASVLDQLEKTEEECHNTETNDKWTAVLWKTKNGGFVAKGEFDEKKSWLRFYAKNGRWEFTGQAADAFRQHFNAKITTHGGSEDIGAEDLAKMDDAVIAKLLDEVAPVTPETAE